MSYRRLREQSSQLSSTINGIPYNIMIIAYRPPLVVLLKGGKI